MGSIAMEEFDLLGDSKYRSYMTQVDRALKGFESTSEWADLIAALTKLNRVLLAHMKFPIIPRRILISKRLAQCMHPDLPPGVHQKALETYDIIFKCMGTNRLAAELFIYSSGLFPLLPNAALNVRSALLSVYETHFVPLGSRLRPGLNGFLSGVLPSLEEGSEHYLRTNSLLEAVLEGVGASVFYSSLWECVATNTTIRLPALTFVLSHLSRQNGRQTVGGVEHQLHILGSDIQVICTALCISLTDTSVLVQRSALELLLQGFPIHQPQFVKSDMVVLVSSVLNSLLRRDMSLNRRLFTWLLGTEVNTSLLPDHHPVVSTSSKVATYFTTYSLQLLIEALLKLLEDSVQSAALNLDIKPFRIITTLLDKAEIGPLIIDQIMVDIWRALYHMSREVGEKQELIKTANLLFAQLETRYVWKLCEKVFSEACQSPSGAEEEREGSVGVVASGAPSLTQTCHIIDFLLNTVSIETYIETSSEHLPCLFQAMVSSLSLSLDRLSPPVLASCLSTLRKVLARVQPAWNVWDVADVAREATESNPGSPVYLPPRETESSLDGGDSERQNLSHDSLVSGCKEMYLTMFTRLVELKILLTPRADWRGLVVHSKVTEPRDVGLHNLLHQVMECDRVGGVGVEDRPQPRNVTLRPTASQYSEAFSLACTLILELSSLPKYKGHTEEEEGEVEVEVVDAVPCWLGGLLLCCVSSRELSPVQLSAVRATVELSSMATSCTPSSQGSSVLVTITPLLTKDMMELVLRDTDILPSLASLLWSSLETPESSSCVSLLLRLVSLARGRVEKVVAASLQVPATSPGQYERYARLWQLSRNLREQTSSTALDLCSVKMMSGLGAERGAVRALCSRWVEESLARGDVGRLMEPLLLSLLDPHTARVSVLHAAVTRHGARFSVSCGDGKSVRHGSKVEQEEEERCGSRSEARQESSRLPPDQEDLTPRTTFPYGQSEHWVNPFALVSSESEYNQDPSITPEPPAETPVSSRPSSPVSSGAPSLSSDASTPRASVSEAVVKTILSEILSAAVDTSCYVLDISQLSFPAQSGEDVTIHPLHSHLLLYTRAVDCGASRHSLQCLQDLVSAQPRLLVSSLATTSLASPSLPRSVQLTQLLARHRQAVFGKGFSTPLPAEVSSNRSSMLLECVISVCLFYTRSYYPALSSLSPDDISGNRELQIMAVTSLNKVIAELVLIVKDNGKSFALYILDLLVRCKLQKVVLHSLLTSVYQLASHDTQDDSFTQQVLTFNDNTGGPGGGETERSKDTEAFQVELLKLVLGIVMLEEVISSKKYDDNSRPLSGLQNSSILKYHAELPFCCQPMFLASVLAALKTPQLRGLHRQWSALVVSCLPVLGPATTQLTTAVSGQLWDNMEQLGSSGQLVTTDYILSQLECLNQILSFCLTESSQTPTSSLTSPPTSLMTNLVHVLGGSGSSVRQQSGEHLASARRALLSTCPRLVTALASLWSSVSTSSTAHSWLTGSNKVIRTTILEVLSPLATLHSTHFIAAVAVAWAEVETVKTTTQTTLVELVSSIKTFPISTIISTLRQVVKSPPPVSGLSKNKTIATAALQFFSSYLNCCQLSQLCESWQELRELLKDCSALSAPAPFLALSILHQFVTRGGTADMERKEAREVQEMTVKLVETIASLAGSRLEAGTWLRGGRSVKVEEAGQTETGQATAALTVLAKLLATLLDIVYQSEEKDRALPLLSTVMYNLVPYLRVHTKANLPLLKAGSSLLASMSEYPFTRRAWKREGMELLLDSSFFKVDHETLKSWRTTTDNLMSHDRTTFKELLTKIASLGQSNISIFSSKELEQEQRALLLKRLAWVIFCSDVDQYQRQMPDITDRLSECLRTVPVSPLVQSAVFLCFRVILLRMSAVHVTFLWPVIITEMVVVFSNMEQELSMDTPEFR